MEKADDMLQGLNECDAFQFLTNLKIKFEDDFNRIEKEQMVDYFEQRL